MLVWRVKFKITSWFSQKNFSWGEINVRWEYNAFDYDWDWFVKRHNNITQKYSKFYASPIMFFIINNLIWYKCFSINFFDIVDKGSNFYHYLAKTSLISERAHESVFNTVSNIDDGVLCENGKRIKAVNSFCKNVHHRCLIGC